MSDLLRVIWHVATHPTHALAIRTQYKSGPYWCMACNETWGEVYR